MASLLDTCGRSLAVFVARIIRVRWWVLFVALALSAAGLRYAVHNLGINTDTANMIATDVPWRAAFDRFRMLFPVRDRNLIVVVESPTPEVTEAVANELAARMRAAPELFPSVFLAGDGEFFARNGLLYQSVDELESLSDRLTAAQPFLGQIRSNPNGAGVLDVLSAALDRAAASEPVEGLDQVINAVSPVLESAANGEVAGLDWAGVLDAGSASSQRQMLLVRPALDFSLMRPAREPIEAVRALAEELSAARSAPVSIRLTGTVAMEHEELDSVVRSASLAGVLALVMVIAVLYWALRSVRLLAISLTVLFVGLILTAALAALLVGHLNLLSVAFAVLYVGLGVDFILHICLRVREALGLGCSINTAIVIAMRSIGASLIVCTLTTAAGFYAFVPSQLFEGISELGKISGTGMFVSFAVSCTLLPAMLAIFYRGRHDGVGSSGGVPITAFARKHSRPVLVVTALVFTAALVSLPGVYFDSNPVNLRDPDSESVVTLGELAADSDAMMLTMVALFDDPEEAASIVPRFEALPEVLEVRTARSLVPEDQQEKSFILDDLAFVLGPDFADFDYEPAGDRALGDAVERLRETLARDGAADTAQSRLADALARAVPGDAAAAVPLEALDRALLGNLPRQLERLEEALHPTVFSFADLPAELRERWVAEDGTTLVEIVPRENIRENAASARFVEAVRSVLPGATGLPVVYSEAARTIVVSFEQALTYAFVAVAAILFLFLRVIRDCIIVLVPIVCAAVVTAGITVWVDVPFNFANIIALPLLVGVGVDNAIHMLHRLRSRALSAEDSGGSTSLAVLASGLTTIASFGNLAFSSHRGMETMGLLLTIGMLVTMLATLVFLPALLSRGVRR
jgi:hopanoid biosynthesis associated RND transporter like protein HpnN